MMAKLNGKRVLLGVTGGIAAYKAAELVRLLRRAGAEVQVVMTAAAGQFITPLTLQALSGRPVRQELFDSDREAAIGHIELARWAELVVVAPATADFLARLAVGRADDLLATLCLATQAPIAVAPAMNQQMWLDAATGENVARLVRLGVRIWGPAEGEQACGETGPGRMLEPEQLLSRIEELLVGGALRGVRAVITAGPTREPIDPVRFVGNRSSGKMGYAVAAACAAAGAEVVLISGPVALSPPPGVERVAVETALEMKQAVESRLEGCDLFIACAAVADYRPVAVAGQKIKKQRETLELELARNPDILAAVAGRPQPPFTVGFAAETERPEEQAEQKRRAKGVDMIAANLVGAPQGGFERTENALTVLWEGGRRELPMMAKEELARKLVELIAERLHEKH
jgi:phosphopantothenoylcysteine decarboxylase/phosphopantothenate--cysteine ligase